MMPNDSDLRNEMERIRRVSDTMCTAHATLRDRFKGRAFALDISILLLTTWLVALSFVAPTINSSLTPFGLDPQVWTGLLSVGTFFLSLVQLKSDWKGRSDAHKRTLDIYAEVKREVGYLLAARDTLDEQSCRRMLARYDMASAVGVEVPEADFLPMKQRHHKKVALSKHIDRHPSSMLWIVKMRWWFHDNFRSEGRGGH